MAGVRWTEKELNFLKENYKGKNSCKKIAEELGRTIKSVYDKSNRLGLKVEWTYERLDKDGYKEVVLESCVKVREHRYVYGNLHNVELSGKEHIHHLDENKLNNEISNLIKVSASTHNKIHGAIKTNDVDKLNSIKDSLEVWDIPKYEAWLKTFIA